MVKIYTKTRCPNCDRSKKLMNKLGIEYKEISLEQTPGAIEEVLSLGFQSAPVIISKEDSWGGFNESKIRKLVTLDSSDWDF